VSSSTSTSKASPETSSGRGPLVIILAIIGILGIVGGILYVSGAANSMHFMVGSVHKGSHDVRAAVSFVVGVAFLVGAFIARSRPAASSAPAGSSAAASTPATGSTAATDSPAAGSKDNS
jgi:hypothetical protein